MKEQDKIPVGKVKRAAKFVGTGAKMGGNYVKYYAKKLVKPEISRDELDEANARDVYESLSELKGSALKVAQMMSMDQNVLPSAYIDKFQMAQYNAPPLSYPLVVRTFKKYFGRSPKEIFDTFSNSAVNAASIGQVHKASLGSKELAVKVQYPGVAESVSSDLRIAKPIAIQIMNVKGKDMDIYFKEVEERLLEETDYELELKRSMELTKSCAHIPDLMFPKYYPEQSCERVLTMDWIDGKHLKEWIDSNPSQESKDRLGQAMWDFYNYQIHELKAVHADPHPGNFIITPEEKLGIIDFGCVKEIPDDFYKTYFELMAPNVSKNNVEFSSLLEKLDFLREDDSPVERDMFYSTFKEMVEILGKPFHSDSFDFSDKEYFQSIFALGERISKDKRFKKANSARGSQHGIYINRTYFGLYTILHEMEAKVKTKVEMKTKKAS